MNATSTRSLPEPLRGVFATPPAPDALRPSPATVNLVRSQVQALLMASPSYHYLAEPERRGVAHDLVQIAAYAAECVRDICWQSKQLGQTPVVRRRQTVAAPLVQAQAADFRPAAANEIGRVTEQTLRAIAFPRFVADLIWGTFNAITQTSIKQMEAFAKLLSSVTKTVDQFMEENISDNQAREWLAQSYPEHIQVQNGQAVVREGADERKPPDFRTDLNLADGVSLDESSIEEQLVPAARRRLAETRLQLLSTLVLMGINRIVVTGGKIRATMGFHIDTRDRAREEQASDLDLRVATAGQFSLGWVSASLSMSLSYVRSTRASSDAELNVESDLTGEVELHFKSDYFPVERFANMNAIGRIQQNTAVPEANTPMNASGPFSAAPAIGGDVPRFTSPRTQRSPAPAHSLPAIGTPLPAPRMPVEPTTPTPPVRRPEPPPQSGATPETQREGSESAARQAPASPTSPAPSGTTSPAPSGTPAAGQPANRPAGAGGRAPESGGEESRGDQSGAVAPDAPSEA